MFFFDYEYETPVRYDAAKFIPYEEDCYDIIPSYFVEKVSRLKFGGNFKVTGEEGRPELISYTIYRFTQYWWILLLYNNLISPDQIISGMVIKFPLLSAVENLFFSLKAKEVQ